MVFVKVRETYDLHTVKNKITVIGIHTPGTQIIKDNYPGLLVQCKGYRPVSCDVRLACASMLPVDPQGIGLNDGDVAPEDMFNPILYKAVSNWSMSQIDAYMQTQTVRAGESVDWNNNGVGSDDFTMYYGLLSQTHEWQHASPQAGFSMTKLRPLVYETYENIGQNMVDGAVNPTGVLKPDGTPTPLIPQTFRGKAHEMPFLNCTAWSRADSTTGFIVSEKNSFPAPAGQGPVTNWQTDVPYCKVFCGCIIVPPSKLHELYYRMVVEWTLEFSQIRSVADLASFGGLAAAGERSHIQSYTYPSSKSFTEETSMVDTSEGTSIHKVM